jgi:hypothetical protein
MSVQKKPSLQVLVFGSLAVHKPVPELQASEQSLSPSSIWLRHGSTPLAQTPAPLHRSPVVHRLPSSQADPVRIVTEHVESPSHTRVLHWSLVHVIDVPPVQTPLELHASS